MAIVRPWMNMLKTWKTMIDDGYQSTIYDHSKTMDEYA